MPCKAVDVGNGRSYHVGPAALAISKRRSLTARVPPRKCTLRSPKTSSIELQHTRPTEGRQIPTPVPKSSHVVRPRQRPPECIAMDLLLLLCAHSTRQTSETMKERTSGYSEGLKFQHCWRRGSLPNGESLPFFRYIINIGNRQCQSVRLVLTSLYKPTTSLS